MSSLGISILILAGAAIIAVVVVNLAQNRARRKRQAAARPAGADEAGNGRRSAAGSRLPGPDTGAGRAGRADRAEPRLGDSALAPAEAGAPGLVADDVHLGAFDDDDMAADGAPAGAAVASLLAAPPVLSQACDCIVVLPFEQPLAGERLLAATQGIRRAGGKPVLFDGLPVTAADEQGAVPLAVGLRFHALRAGVLLANRHGPLNAMEYPEFVAAVQGIADQLGALADIPEMADALARARDLDATCAQLDAQIGLNVDVPEPLGPAQLAALAERLGLVDRGGHRHVRLGSAGEVSFTMWLTDSPQRIGFLLDVPRAANALDDWGAMIETAQEAAAQLSGRLVDDAGRPIPLDALDTIARQLAQRLASLETIGLPAGSPPALRVFN